MNEIITKQAPPPMPPINIAVLCFDMKLSLLEFPEKAGTGAESEGGEADGLETEPEGSGDGALDSGGIKLLKFRKSILP